MNPPISEDVLRFWCWKATRNYDSSQEALFTNANFAQIMQIELKLKTLPDGLFVRMILTGRHWLERRGDLYERKASER